jgi:phosphoribosyl-ATP pyrophosphohydrolase
VRLGAQSIIPSEDEVAKKLKLPVKRAVGPAPSKADAEAGAPARKRKAKSTGKSTGKLKKEAAASGAAPARKRVAKAKRKPGRREAPLAAIEGAGELLVKTLAAVDSAASAVLRPRKLRPGAPLARLERLELAIGEVRSGGRTSARTRKLLSSGVHKMAQKLIEEAAEAGIEAIRGEQTTFVEEVVDLFYNLLVLCSELGVPLGAIWAEMDRREQMLGMAEKLPKTGET